MILSWGRAWFVNRWSQNTFVGTTEDPTDWVLGDSGAAVSEEQIGIQGNAVFDSTAAYASGRWNTLTIGVATGASLGFGDNFLQCSFVGTDYDGPSMLVREICISADYAAVAAGTPGQGVGGTNYYPVARFLPTPFTIDAGDSLDISWLLELRDDLSDG